jgi:hypothetical protein
MRTIAIIALLTFSSLISMPASGHAAQYTRGNQVVHTRLAPVVVHRVFPPFYGRHVYQGRLSRR